MLKYLRIAVTASSLTACVLLVALWVRSNWYLDEFWIPLPYSRALGCVSVANCGSIGLQRRELDPSVYIVGYSSTDDWQTERGVLRGFSIIRESDVFYWNVPYWFLVLLFAVIPWLPYRFSLRTLLIATALVAVGLGMVVYLSS
jgi:hypothetical protein